MDAVDAYQQGVESGQQVFIRMINQYCDLEIRSLPELIEYINTLKENQLD